MEDGSLRCILLVNLGFKESIIAALIGCIYAAVEGWEWGHVDSNVI